MTNRVAGWIRGARAYLPGFGTAGSLLAGAVLMFIVASALVAFRGWPHVGAQPCSLPSDRRPVSPALRLLEPARVRAPGVPGPPRPARSAGR
jgi:hypothetical protein